ncbi:MAG: zinc-binding dehydrogenase [Fidelibacterota bacterium]|nr:MAG: zinc-binding dehydrogenase [Candidatus Neomarinimicrobiota bacterium]
MKDKVSVMQVQISRHGGPKVLRMAEVSPPDLRQDEVLVRTHFAGINFADIMARLGLYPGAPGLPTVPGYEVSGEVMEAGSEVTVISPGQHVFGLTRFGGYSSQVAVPQGQVRPVPEGISMEAVAALPVTYLTAYLMMFNLGHLNAGQTVLIHSAGGGVGTAAVQLASIVGARIFATASVTKHKRLQAMGVELCIDYRQEDFVQRVKEATAGRGVDLILDAQGPAHFRRDYHLLSPLGTLVMYGVQHNIGRTRLLSMPWRLLREVLTVRFAPLSMMHANRGIYGFHLGRLWDHLGPVEEALDQLLTWLREGRIDPVIDRIFSYDQAVQAHSYIQDRRNFGKVLLDFRASSASAS